MTNTENNEQPKAGRIGGYELRPVSMWLINWKIKRRVFVSGYGFEACGLQLVVHRPRLFGDVIATEGWRVSEYSTGAGVGGTAQTRREAIQLAIDRCKSKGPKAIANALRKTRAAIRAAEGETE